MLPLTNLLDQALKVHRSGDLMRAASLYQEVLKLEPDHSRALGLLGLIEHDLGRSDSGIRLLRRSVELDAGNAAMRVNLGTVLAESGQIAPALEQFLKATDLAPNDISALENTILLLGKTGRMTEGLQYIERAAQLQPDSATAQFRLAISCLNNGDVARGYEVLMREPLKSARIPGLNLHRAAASLAMQRPEEALASARLAVAESPKSAASALLLAQILYRAGVLAEAIEQFRKAIALGAGTTEAKTELSLALLQAGQLLDAEEALKQLSEEHPEAISDQGSVREALAISHWRAGDESEARRILSSPGRSPLSAAERAALALMIPQIMESVEHINEVRTRYESSLDELLAEPPALSLPHSLIGTSNFYLAFHGYNNRTLQEKFSRFCRAADPGLTFVAPHCEMDRQAGGRLRVGFLTKFIMEHSVSICFSKIVEAVSKSDDFDVSLISTSSFEEAGARRNYANFAGTKVQLVEGDIHQSRKTIADLKLDVLMYMDIGMDLDSHCLAHARLAPIQCVLGGHPDTTGIDTIDFHVSSAIAELPEADAHYSEELIRLPIGLFYFQRPELPQSLFGYRKSRSQMGLPTKGRIYLCPASLQKLHPEFDLVIDEILQKDTDGHVILFRNPQIEGWNSRIIRRLERSVGPAQRDRLHLLPWVQHPIDFANAVAVSDVVLEPFHFGLGSTAAITNFVGTPTIAKPTSFLRGRTGYFYSRMLNLPECLAEDTSHFVNLAISMASDKDFRKVTSSRIRANNHVLYENMRPVSDFVEMLRRL